MEVLAYLCLLVFAVDVSASGAYSGYKVLRISANDEELSLLLEQLQADFPDVEVWRGPACAQCDVDVQVSPSDYYGVNSVLSQYGLRSRIFINDLQELLDVQQREPVQSSRFGSSRNDKFDYGRYHTIDEIYEWIKEVSVTYKDKVTVFNITHTFEGRPLMGIKIRTGSDAEKPAFWIEGGIHANEWIAPATVLYMAGQMLEQYKKDPDITVIVDMFDWYILPSTNPDGYAYTWKDKDTRMWRKTRSQRRECYGSDPNRNWPIGFGGAMTSNDSCNRLYCGEEPFSEPEVEGVAKFMAGISNLKGFIDFHSYGEMWMSSWAYTRDYPLDYSIAYEGSKLAVEALEKVHGTKYRYGTIAHTLYQAGGMSTDYVYSELGVRFSYLVELRGNNGFGFLLPEDQIIPSGEETLVGLMALAKYVYEN